MVALALELVAFFGFVCILLNVLLPSLAFVVRFVAADAPREWRKWQRHRAQQRELRRLQRCVDKLSRRKQAEEQETRRRVKATSAQKRQQTEEIQLQPFADLVHTESSSKRKVESTPRPQRHRLSIYSTIKKTAASSLQERRRKNKDLNLKEKKILYMKQHVLDILDGGRMAGSPCVTILVLVCGLPAAGKTTLVKHLVASNSTPSRLYERISFDEFYEQMTFEDSGVEFDPVKWKTCQQEMTRQVTKHIEEQSALTSSKRSTHQLVLLVDDTFHYRSLRKRFSHLAIELNCGFALVYLNVPAAICGERNAGRNIGAQVPDEVFQRMVAAFEPPSGSQNTWEINTWEWNGMGDASDIEKSMSALVQKAENELKQRRLLQIERQSEETQQRRDRLKTQQNILHLVDLQLRQWISTQLQDASALSLGITKAQLASHLNQRRKDFLASMKHSTNDMEGLLHCETIEQVVVLLVLRFQQQE